MRIRQVIAVATALAVVGTLSGCAFLRPHDDALPAPSRTPHAARTPSATAVPDAPLSGAALQAASATPRPPTAAPTEASAPAPTISSIAPGTVVAQGDVASPKGSVHFHFRMVAAAGDTFQAEYSGFTSTLPVPVSVALFEVPRRVGDGLTYNGIGDHQLGGATPAPGTSATAPLDGSGLDPSHLGTLVTYSSASTDQDPQLPIELRSGKVLAVSTVRWSVPARTTNVHPVDAGARPNAAGRISATTASGAPRSYVVASNDLIESVAARFGISVQDLIWLNPDARVFGDQQYLYEGTTLNLDPVGR